MTSDIIEKLSLTIDCKQGAVRAVRFNADGNYCISCGSDKSVKLWNPHTNILLKTYSGHGYDVLDAQGSFDNATICSCGMDKAVIQWDVASGQVLRKYRGHAGCVNCVAYNDEATVIFSGSVDGTLKSWDSRSKSQQPIQAFDEHTDSVTCVHVTDHEILTGCADGYVRRYDIRNGVLATDYVGCSVTCVGLSRDGQCLLVGTQDSTVRLLDKASGELLNEFKGHKNDKYKIDCCISASDVHVLCGSEDGKVYIWDLVQAKLLSTLEHKGVNTVHSLSFHPKDPKLLTASLGKAYLWTSAHTQTMV